MGKLSVSNPTYLVSRTIAQASPEPMMIRELVQNALEACVTATNPQIEITEVDPALFGFNYDEWKFSNRKLCFWNNGTGMSAKELQTATDLSSSLHKTQSVNANFGIGAKALSMSVNETGMIWVSCKDKKVSTVLLHGKVNNVGQIEYYRYDFFDCIAASNTGCLDVYDITDFKTVPWSTDQDWTAIILCGNDLLQETGSNPYDPKAKPLTSAWLINTIYRRFYRIPENVNFTLNIGHSKGKTAKVKFTPIWNYISKLTANFAKQNRDDVREEVVVDRESGIKIWYVYDGPYSGKSKDDNPNKPTSTVSNPATTPTFSALVYKDEMYDVSTDIRWKTVAARLGILYGAKYLRIFVELPDSAAVMPDQYRKYIQVANTEKNNLEILNFSNEIRKNMPEWFKDKIRQYTPNDNSNTTVWQRGQDFLESLLTQSLSWGKNLDPLGRNTKTHGIKTGTGPSHGPSIKKSPRMAVDGSDFNISINMPTLQFIRVPADLENASAPNLANRAAEYVEDSALYINCMYDAVGQTVENMLVDYQDKDPTMLDRIEEEAKEIASTEMAWLVVRAVAHTLAKKRKPTYDESHLEEALSATALTIHADNLIFNLDECKKQLKEKVKQIEEGLI